MKAYQVNWLQYWNRTEKDWICYELLHYCPTRRRIPDCPAERGKYQL